MQFKPLLALVASLAVTAPLAALPPAPPAIQVADVQPVVNNMLVYLPLPAPTLGAADAAQLTIDLYLQNVGAYGQLIQYVSVQFPGSAVPGVNLAADLELRCPTDSDALPALAMAPGQVCRLSLLPDMKIPHPGPAQVSIRVYVVGNPIPLVINRPLAAHVNSPPNGSYRFPVKAEDLPAGYYWSGQSSGAGSHHRAEVDASNMLAYDLGVVRFDGGTGGTNTWVGYYPPENGESDPDDENDDWLGWDMPVYAMADGIVKACTFDNEDNAVGVASEDYGPVNSLTIEHGTEKAWYGHLRNGSIDPAVCGENIPVSAGQFLGRLGNSGQSSKPHLHVHVTKSGKAVPLLFNDLFVMARDASSGVSGNEAWSGVKNAGLLWEKSVIWPSGLRRHDSVSGEYVTQLTMASSTAARKVTLARDGSGALRADLWNLDLGDVELSHVATDVGGAVANGAGTLALARPKNTNEMTAVIKTAAGNMKLIAYDVQNNALVRAVEMNESPVQAVAATSAGFTNGIVTAVRTQGGNLKVIAYETNAGSGFISRRGDEGSGAVKTVAVTTAKAFEGVVTASRSSDDKLRIETFEVGPGGFFVNKIAQVDTATSILDASVAWLGERADGSDLVLTAARRTDGTLWVVAWSVSPAGSITLLDTAFGGEISGVSIARYDADHAITGMTDSGSELKLVAWHVTANGTLVRRAEAEGGTASKVSVTDAAPFYYGGPSFTTTALRDGSGNLRLIDWQVLLTD